MGRSVSIDSKTLAGWGTFVVALALAACDPTPSQDVAALPSASQMASARPEQAPRQAGSNAQHLSPAAWTSAQWQAACKGVRTSYNPDTELSDETLTLVPGKKRWLDFVFWALNNKIAEHQVEQYGGTGWDGPTGGVIFYWAPGSHWERNTLASFGFTIGHVIGEHRWRDTMFPEFFESYGGVYGVNVKDRLAEIDPASPGIWVKFLEHIGSAKSPYYRYLFHQEAVVDPAARAIHLLGGQGVSFTYSFERYYHELREVLTDCRAVDFFQMYDRFGHGFASRGDWARQAPPGGATVPVGYAQGEIEPGPVYQPNPAAVEVPANIRESASMQRGKDIYLAQCAVCHGVRGDGRGFLAQSFRVPPRDFTQAQYRIRSTAADELPTIEDLTRVIKDGVPGTTMPAWGQFLKPEQMTDVARYLVLFSKRFRKAWSEQRTPKAIEVPAVPQDLATLAERGEPLWKQYECAKCHGPQGKGDGPSAADLKDSAGHPIAAADLTYKWGFKSGHQPEDLYRTFMAGFSGTPMPSYASALASPDDAWALVAYVLAMSPDERPVIRLKDFAAERASRIGPSGRVLPRGAP